MEIIFFWCCWTYMAPSSLGAGGCIVISIIILYSLSSLVNVIYGISTSQLIQACKLSLHAKCRHGSVGVRLKRKQRAKCYECRLWAIGRPVYVAANAMLVCPSASGAGLADPVMIIWPTHMYQNMTRWCALSGQAMGSFAMPRLWRWSVKRDCEGPNESPYMTI